MRQCGTVKAYKTRDSEHSDAQPRVEGGSEHSECSDALKSRHVWAGGKVAIGEEHCLCALATSTRLNERLI